MKTFSGILILSIVGSCLAGLLGPATEDFSSIDENGGYHFGYNDGRLARQEERSPEGVVRGAYSYVDANGQTQTVTYTADSHNGFLASGSSIPKVTETEPVAAAVELPVAIEDTPEVKAAKAEHLEAHKKVLSGEVPSVPAPAPVVVNQLPLPLQYTTQFAATRAPIVYIANHGLVGYNGYNGNLPITYTSQPGVQYVIQNAGYHPDYLPYAGL